MATAYERKNDSIMKDSYMDAVFLWLYDPSQGQLFYTFTNQRL